MRRRDLILAAAAPLAAQTKATKPFEFVSVNGEKLSTAGHGGKAVALYFFNPACGTCQHTCMLLSAIQNEMGDSLRVLGATFTEDARQTMGPFQERFRLSYPVGFAARADIVRWLGVSIDDNLQMPGLSVVDAKGVRRAHFGWRDPIFQTPGEKGKIETAIRKAAGLPPATPVKK